MHDFLYNKHNVAPSTFVRLRKKLVEGSLARYQEMGCRSNRQHKLCAVCPPMADFVDCRTHTHSADWMVQLPLAHVLGVLKRLERRI